MDGGTAVSQSAMGCWVFWSSSLFNRVAPKGCACASPGNAPPSSAFAPCRCHFAVWA